MRLDLFTIIAQVVNFLVLVALLRHFLYGPIIRMMGERQQRITTELDNAHRLQKEAEEAETSCRGMRKELEDNRGEMLSESRDEAEAWKKEIMRRAREEVEDSRKRWIKALEREKDSFMRDLRRRAGEQAYGVISQALNDLAGVELERQIIATFISRLKTLDDSEIDKIADAVNTPGEVAAIYTAFDIAPADRDDLQAAVRSRLGRDVRLRFERAPELVCGIELRSAGHKFSWSLETYLVTLQENLSQAFAAEGQLASG